MLPLVSECRAVDITSSHGGDIYRKKIMLLSPRLVCVVLQVSQMSFVLVCLLNQAVKATPMSSFTADKPSLDQNIIGAVSSGQCGVGIGAYLSSLALSISTFKI